MLSNPTHCPDPRCGKVAIKPIHCSSRRVVFDSPDGPEVFAHLVVYRCSHCGNTWGVQGNPSIHAMAPALVGLGRNTLRAGVASRSMG